MTAIKGKKLTLKEAALILGIHKNSLRRQLQRGAIIGRKDKNGCWEIFEEEVYRYMKTRYQRKNIPEGTYTISQVCQFSGLSRKKIYALIEEGELEAVTANNIKYISRISFHFWLDEESKKNKEPAWIEECSERVEIINHYGVDRDVAIEFLKIMGLYPSHRVTVFFLDEKGHYIHEITNCLSLLNLRIQKNNTIIVRCSGKKAIPLLDDLTQAAKKLFGLVR